MGNEFYFGEMDVRRLERLTDAVERLADNLEKQAVKVEISDAPAPRLSLAEEIAEEIYGADPQMVSKFSYVTTIRAVLARRGVADKEG
jgi:hypothetical protein